MVRNLLVVAVLIAVLAGVAWRNAPHSAAPPATQTAAPSTAAAVPKVATPANVHQFGIMNPGDRRKHKFTVRNDGTAPLTLKLSSTTCKCTLANLERAEVPPGGQTEIELDWHTEHPQFRFRQAALLDTNDPATPQFELAVEGSVRVKLGTVPESVVFTEVPQDERRELQLALFSQAYASVRVTKLESTLPGVEAAVSGLEHDNLVIDHARWARDLVVVRAPDGRSGSFEGKLRIHYVGRTPDGAEESGVHEVPVYGETVGDVTLHGRHVVGKILMLGQTSRFQSKTSRAYVHFRNAPENLKVELFAVEPKLLQVTVGAPQRLSPTMTRVPVDVVVPAGAEPGNYSNDNLGHVGLSTNCDAYPKAWLQVSLVVEP